MIGSELNESLIQTFDTCELHLKRMTFAKSKVAAFIPLNRDNYYRMDDETIGFLDQYIFRFSKLQDTMGSRLFLLTLEGLAEPVADKAFSVSPFLFPPSVRNVDNLISDYSFAGGSSCALPTRGSPAPAGLHPRLPICHPAPAGLAFVRS